MPTASVKPNLLEQKTIPVVGYLLSRYPAISHTFFLKEVIGLRARGMTIEVASINPPDRPRNQLPPVESAQANETFYVKPDGLAKVAFSIAGIAIANPAVTLRGLAAALKLGGWDLKSRAFALFYLAEALLVGDWMRRRSLKHLHVHFGGPVATVGMLAAQAWQVPWSMTLHGPDEFFDQEAFYLNQKIGSAAFVICISDFCRSQVMRISSSQNESNLETVRLGVEWDQLQVTAKKVSQRGMSGSLPTVPDELSDMPPDSKLARPPQHRVHIVCTGRMVAAKGHRILLEALAALPPATEVNCTLIGDGPERAALEGLCTRLGILPRVSFLGARPHDETLALVATADIFVLASFAEGLPVALMEAMAMGVPCVSTTIAAIPEMIHDGVNGLLVPPANVQALSEALERLATDSHQRDKFGEAARITAKNEYNLATNLDQLEEMWQRRIARKA